jgi:hypothetical protein
LTIHPKALGSGVSSVSRDLGVPGHTPGLDGVFPGLQGFGGKIFARLPTVVFGGITFPVDVVVVLAFDYLASHDAFDGVLVLGVVLRGFSEQFRAWAEVKLDSGDVDSRMSLTTRGKF